MCVIVLMIGPVSDEFQTRHIAVVHVLLFVVMEVYIQAVRQESRLSLTDAIHEGQHASLKGCMHLYGMKHQTTEITEEHYIPMLSRYCKCRL